MSYFNKVKYIIFIIPFLFLFTSKVKGYEIKISGYTFEEQDIEYYFRKVDGFDIKKYPYISCTALDNSDDSSTLNCYAFSESTFKSMKFDSYFVLTNMYYFMSSSSSRFCEFTFNLGSFSITDSDCNSHSSPDLQLYFPSELIPGINTYYNFKITDIYPEFELDDIGYKLNFSEFLYTDFKGIPLRENLLVKTQTIYDNFKKLYSDFSLDEYPYVACDYLSTGVYKDDPEVTCFAASDLSAYRSYSNAVGISRDKVLAFRYRPISKTLDNNLSPSDYILSTVPATNITTHIYSNFSVFDIPELFDEPGFTRDRVSIYLWEEVLNFDNVYKMEFDPDIFEKDSNFNKYCVDSSKAFAVTVDSFISPDDYYYFNIDFLWFPYHLTGLYRSEYTTQVTGDDKDNINTFDDEVATEHFWFSDYPTIYEFYNNPDNTPYFDRGGYDNIYDYYGYTAYRFTYHYQNVDGEIATFFPIYTFKNPEVTYIDNVDELPSYTFDDEIKNNNYCFYLQKPFVVQYVERDSFGDFFGTVVTPEGDLDISTSHNKDNYDSSSASSTLLTFLSETKGTILFVNNSFYNFFEEMPSLFKLFILSIFTLLLFKIIIGMVTR